MPSSLWITESDREATLREGRRAARLVLKDHGVRAPEHIQLERIAAALGATITTGGLEGARARLCRGPRPVIRISDRLTHPGARRFSLAHELGHLVLDHPPAWLSAAYAGGGPAVGHPASQAALHEDQADAFASELLMPEALARPLCEISPLDLRVAQAIADRFQTSILAAALRVAELTSERCAVIFSEAGRVRWSFSSPSLPWTVPRGQPLDPATVAYDYFRRGQLDPEAQPVDVGAWFETNSDADVVEHSAAMESLRATLSLIWIPESTSERLGLP